MTKLVTLSGTTSDEIWPKLEEVVSSFPIKIRAEARGREREKNIRDAVGMDNPERGRIKANAGIS